MLITTEIKKKLKRPMTLKNSSFSNKNDGYDHTSCPKYKSNVNKWLNKAMIVSHEALKLLTDHWLKSRKWKY